MPEARHRLPERNAAPRIALVGAALLVTGLALAALIVSDLAAANARDLAVNTWFWELGQSHAWLLQAAGAISWFADGARSAVIAPVLIVLLFGLRQWRWAVFLLVSSQAGLLLSNALKFAIARERPPFVEHSGLQQNLSFPSGQTFAGFTIWAAAAIIAWYLLRPPWANVVTVALLAVGLLQAPTRLIVGKHWITDVIGSWLIGAGWLLLVWAGFLWWLAPREPAATITSDGRPAD